METIIGAVFGAFGLGIITAVIGFCRERLKTADKQYDECREEAKWYREKLLPVLEHQQDTLEKRSQQMIEALEELRREGRGHANK